MNLYLQVSGVVFVDILRRRREHGPVEVVGGSQRDATAEGDDRQDSASHNRRIEWRCPNVRLPHTPFARPLPDER